MQTKYAILITCFMVSLSSFAQKKNFTYKFYGQIRNDVFYNTRSNAETVDGLFYMYPNDEKLDVNGEDLNKQHNSNFCTMYSRIGVDLTGPMLGKAKTSAKLEADFRGSGKDFYFLRLRQAYFNLDWGTSALLLGQTWHPLYGDVAPQILNLNMGAPFNPFGRAPQLRYRYTNNDFRLTLAAIWQSQYKSTGEKGKSNEYIKNSGVPEIFVGIDYKSKHWTAGIGAEFLSLCPRTVGQATVYDESGVPKLGADGKELTNDVKVKERISSLSYEAHVKYTKARWYMAAKTTLGNNLTQNSMVGGYAVTGTNKKTGKNNYTPVKVSSTWFNLAYGSKWRPAIFAGYLKNLGTNQKVERLVGAGIDKGLDQLANVGVELTYNLKHWKFGVEYNYCTAWYGKLNTHNGRMQDTHTVSNHRVVGVAMFLF